MRYLDACIAISLAVALVGCTGGSPDSTRGSASRATAGATVVRPPAPAAGEVAQEPSERLITEMLAAAVRTPTATPEVLIPTPKPDPEIYIESGQVFFEIWMGKAVKQPPREVGSQVGEEPQLEDAVAIWRDFFQGTRVLALGITYDLCRDGIAIYISGAPGMWPEGTTLTYRLLPYKSETGFDYSHIELQISPDQPELLFFRRKYQAYHLANVNGYTVGFFFGETLIDAPVIASAAC